MRTVISPDRQAVLTRFCQTAPPGVIAELGVYQGGSLKVMVDALPDRRQVFGFDTFEGLPVSQWNAQEPTDPGLFADTSLETIIADFAAYPNVVLIKGLFPGTFSEEHRQLKYAVVHIDCDYYIPVKAALELFWPRMVPGGTIIMDDFHTPWCPGIDKAIEELGLPAVETAQYQCSITAP